MASLRGFGARETGRGAAEAAAGPSSDRDAPALLPPVDVIEDSTGITLYADLPGVPRVCRSSTRANRLSA